MKKIIMLSVIMLSLSACSSGNTSSSQSNPAASEATTASVVTAQEAAPRETAGVDASGNQILYDYEGIRITATGLAPDVTSAPTIPVTIENGSKLNISVQVKSFSVNGYMQECVMSTSIPAGETKDTEIVLFSDALNRCGIKEIAEADIAFHVFDDATWNTIFDSDPVIYHVAGAESYAQNFDDSGEILFDENQIKIVSKGLSETDGQFGPQVMLYIENNSEKNITVQAHDTLANGIAMDSMLSAEVMAGKKTVCSLSFMDIQLKENGIETIDSLETKINIFDSGWNTIVDTDAIAISVK